MHITDIADVQVNILMQLPILLNLLISYINMHTDELVITFVVGNIL